CAARHRRRKSRAAGETSADSLHLRDPRMCGIAGIVGTSGVNQRIYDALTVLQHRGQDAAGIATVQDGELFTRKGRGLVRDVFETHHMLELKGNMGMGHVRYPTAGCDNASEAQPFYV